MVAFFLNYTIENMLLPGKIENWVIVSDFEKQGFGDLSMASIKQVVSVLTDNFRCRLGVNYVVNPSKIVYFTWTCVKPFLDEVLIEKVKILNKPTPDELLTHCNPYQVEEKYGGRAPNVTQYWPPTMPNAPYTLDGTPFLAVPEKKERSFESQILPPSDDDTKYKRRSISINEKIFPHEDDNSDRSQEKTKKPKKKLKKKKQNTQEDEVYKEKYKNKEQKFVEEEYKIDDEEEEIEREKERQRQKQEKKERKKQREMRRELKKREKGKEKDNINEATESRESDQAKDSEARCDEDLESSNKFMLMPQEVIVENEKQEVGCGMCSGFPTINIAGKKCSIF